MIKRILVSQPQPNSAKSPYYNVAEKHGVELVFRPFIRVEGVGAKEFRKQKVNIPDYTAAVFTSRAAVDHFFRILSELRTAPPESMKYFAISETVALYIQKYTVYRKRKVFFGASGKLPELVSVMARHKEENYLVPLSDVHDDHVRQALDGMSLRHSECVMYRTVSNDFAPGEKFDYDMLVFFSPAGIHSLLKNFPRFSQGDIRIACFGPATAKAVSGAGLRLDLEAPTVTAPSMPSALDIYLSRHGR